MSLKQKAAQGVMWASGAKFLNIGLQFGITVLLVRLLTPPDFGFLAMAMVFIGFAQKFNDLGFGSALVQFKTIRNAHASSIFWLNLVFGTFLFIVFWVLAPLIADFYGTPRLVQILHYLSLAFIINAIGYVPNALLQRHMKFDRLAKLEIVTMVISGGVAIAMALNGWGVMSLVAQLLVRYAVGSILVWFLIDWAPAFQYSGRAVRQMFGYSMGYSGFHIVNYWARKVDDLLVGRMIGTAALGIYDRAYQLMLNPISLIVEVLSKVMFPALSTIKDEPERVKRIYRQMISILALLIFPMMAGLFSVARPLVLAFFGAKWIGVVPIIMILCPVGMLQVLTMPVGLIYTSQGRTDWLFWWGIGGSGLLIIALIIGVTFGTVQAVAFAYLIANIVLLYPCLAISGSLIDLTFGEILRVVWPSFFCSVGMAAIVWYLKLFLQPVMGSWAQLGLLVPAGIILYAGALSIFRLDVYKDFRRLAAEQWAHFKNS